MGKRFLQNSGPLIGISLFAVALWVIHHELEQYHYHDILNQLRSLPARQVFAASVLTVMNYVIMTGYDLLALKYINYHLAFRRIAVASFIGYAFSNSIGLSMLAGGSVRYRLYSAWGLSAEDITKVVVFCTMTLWMGLLVIGGIVFIAEPVTVPGSLHLPFTSVRPVGLIFILAAGIYMAWSSMKKGAVKIMGWEFPIPPIKIFLSQITVASLDWILAGSVLYALIPLSAEIPFMKFIGIYLLAQTAGLASQVPGGLGVFETVIMVLLSKDISASAILSALLAYRAVYYLIPLCVAAAMLGAREVFERREGIQRTAALFGQWITGLTPHVLSLTTFLGGMILLFSGSTPVMQHRLEWLKDILPLPVMEMSHFFGSIAGMALLLLARGIQQRLDAAYVLAIVSLSAGIVFSLLKGVDYEEAAALLIMLAALLPCRRYFYRKASVMSQRYTSAWIAAITITVMSSVWLGIFSYKHVEYSGELWWQFAFSGDASRFLRATTGVLAVTLFFSLGRLLRLSPAASSLLKDAALTEARNIIEETGRTYANLALLGDKEILSVMQDLRRISDAWLTQKNTREKRFSLGYFNEDYLRNFPAAVISRDGKVIAFANIWAGKDKSELSIDLMRYLPDAPNGIMDYLFVNLMLWGKQQGYRNFNLGMAPFSGLQASSLAPLWNRLGTFIYRHGEHFYNFQGLRQYKDKFAPEWRPKYIALPGGLRLPRILANIASLVSQGLKGVVSK